MWGGALGSFVGALIILGVQIIVDKIRSYFQYKKEEKYITRALETEIGYNMDIVDKMIELISRNSRKEYQFVRFQYIWLVKYCEKFIDYSHDDCLRLYSFLYGAKASMEKIEDNNKNLSVFAATSKALSSYHNVVESYNKTVLSLATNLKTILEATKKLKKENKIYKDDVTNHFSASVQSNTLANDSRSIIFGFMDRIQKFARERVILLISIGLFIFTLLLYVSTLPNTNTGYADADEFLTVAKVWGVAHPSGYPLYTFMSAIAGRLPLPFLNFAGRVNFMSAVLGGMSIVLVFLTANLFLRRNHSADKYTLTSSAIAASALAVMFGFWFYSLNSEMIALHLFLFNLALMLITFSGYKATFTVPHRIKYLVATAIVVGLGIGHNQTFLLFIPTLTYWALLLHWKHIRNPKLITALVLITIMAFLLPFVYVPIAASRQPPINWENAQTPSALGRLITRRAYAGDTPTADSAYLGGSVTRKNAVIGLPQYWRFVQDNVTLPFIGLALLGIVFLIFLRRWRDLILTLLGMLGGGIFFSVYAVNLASSADSSFLVTSGIHERFFMASLPFWAFLIGFGIWGAAKLLGKMSERNAYLVFVLAGLLVLLVGDQHYREMKKNNFGAANLFGKSLLTSLDKNAILICFTEQSCFTTMYVQEVEQVRRDVIILPSTFDYIPIEQFKRQHLALLKSSVNANTTRKTILAVRDLIRWNIDQRPLYVAGINTASQALSFYGLNQDPFFLVPQGCALRVSRTFKLQSFAQPCIGLDKSLVQSYSALQAPITDMFPAYMAYQHYFNGQIFKDQECYALSLAEYKKALAYNPYFLFAQYHAEQLEKKHLADKCESHGTALSRELLETKINELEAKKDYTSAIYFALQNTMIDPGNVVGRLKLAELYEKTKYFKDNIKVEYQDVLQLDPKNEVARMKLKQL